MNIEKYPDVLIEALKKRIDALDNIVAENTKAIRYDIRKLIEATASNAEVSSRHHSDLTTRLCRLEQTSKGEKMPDNLDVVGMAEKQRTLNNFGWRFRNMSGSEKTAVTEALEELIEFSFGLYGQARRNKERIDDLEKKLKTALESIEALECFAQRVHLDNLDKGEKV